MDSDTRLALLESQANRIEQDHLKLVDSIADLTEAVNKLNEWQTKIDLPIRGAGFFFIGLLSAAGYGLWAFLTARFG